MKKAIRILFVTLVFLLCTVMTACGGKNAAAGKGNKPMVSSSGGMIDTDDFRIRISCGLDGNYRSGAPVPVTIKITSLQSDFEGAVRLIVPGDNYGSDGIAYEQEILLSAGEEKTVVSSVNCSNGLMSLGFELVDESDKIQISQLVTLKSSATITALAGVLSDDFTALSYMNQVSLNLTSGFCDNVDLVELTADIMPTQESGLECLSYLIINSFDTSKLSQSQYDAIKRWVKAGGVLILGTGSDYKETLAAFGDELVTGSIHTKANGTYYVYGGDTDEENKNSLEFSSDQGLLSLTVDDAKEMEGVFTEKGLIWDKEVDSGHVVVCAFNLGMEPLNSWTEKVQFAGNLLNCAASGYSADRIYALNYGYENYSDYGTNALSGMIRLSLPNMELLWSSFGIFLLFIGILLYLILKKADRRGLIWILIPVVSLAFTAGILAMTSGIRLKNVEASSLTFFYEDKDTGSKSKTVQLGFMIPQNGKHQINLNSSLTNLKMQTDSDYWYSNNNEIDYFDYATAIRETAQGYSLTFHTDSTFSQKYLTTDCSVTENIRGLDAEIKNNTTGISGTVTNNTGWDLNNVLVAAQNSVVKLGSLKAGESRAFEELDGIFYSYYDDVNLMPDDIEESDPVFRTVVRSGYNFMSRYCSNMKADEVYLYGFIKDWEADYIDTESIREVSAASVVSRYVVPFDDYKNAVRFSLYDYLDTVVNGEWDSDGQMWTDTCEVEFDVSGMCSDIYAITRLADENARYGSTENVVIYAYNEAKEQYEEIFADDSLKLEFEDGCPYLNAKGKIRLKFEGANSGEDYSPQITVIGGGY